MENFAFVTLNKSNYHEKMRLTVFFLGGGGGDNKITYLDVKVNFVFQQQRLVSLSCQLSLVTVHLEKKQGVMVIKSSTIQQNRWVFPKIRVPPNHQF